MFRFTIRDVLWLTVVVGLGCGWWLQFRSITEESLRRKNWEESARSVERTSKFSVQFHDNGACTFYPRGYKFK
jgi:hypothetical protein